MRCYALSALLATRDIYMKSGTSKILIESVSAKQATGNYMSKSLGKTKMTAKMFININISTIVVKGL